MLQEIAGANPQCFQKLFHYDLAIQLNYPLCKKQWTYLLSHDVKEILLDMQNKILANELIKKEELDQSLMDYMSFQLSIQKIHRLFFYMCFNLQSALLVDDLNLNLSLIEHHLTLLNDLFSQRFRFGRACFARPLHELLCYSHL